MSGDIFAIGGHEDKTGDRVLLREFVKSMPRPKVVIVTAATQQPEASFERYQEAFGDLEVESVVQLDVRSREESEDPGTRMVLNGAGGFFFTGGDQKRIVETLADTGLSRAMRLAWRAGAAIGGTSAGASVMSAAMLVRGHSGSSESTEEVSLAAGLGYLERVIVDQHFAERGRIGRLLAAVAQKPDLLGLGIDENTGVCVRGDQLITFGEGAVTVLDASGAVPNRTQPGGPAPLSIFDVRLHQLVSGNQFDIPRRMPSEGEPE